jgi:hypothetical protein
MPGKVAKHTGFVPNERPVFDDSKLATWERELLGQAGINRLRKIDERSRESFETSVEYGYTVRLVGGKPIDFKKVQESKPRQKKTRQSDDEDQPVREGR